MLYLWLSIFCSTGIYLLFKLRQQFNANLSGGIILNYLFATLLGFFLQPRSNELKNIVEANWLPIAGIIGLLFVIMFFLIGYSTENAGIVVTSIATRMSMVFPILFSMLLFQEIITLSKTLKILLTFLAVFLSIYKKPNIKSSKIILLLPLILFVGSGSVDTLVKTAQHLYVPDQQIQTFSMVLFATSFLASLFLFVFKKKEEKLFSWKTLIFGTILGAFNFGSLFFIMKALNNSGLDSSLVFGINNLAIVCLSLLLGYFAFTEKLSKINWMGIALSLICIVLLSQTI